MNFNEISGLRLPEGKVVSIQDLAGNVLWNAPLVRINGTQNYYCADPENLRQSLVDDGLINDIESLYIYKDTKLYNSEFESMPNLKSVEFETDYAYNISSMCFKNCLLLESVNFGNPTGKHDFTVNPRAFEGCSALKTISLPDGVTSIGKYTFNGCTSLTSVTIPNSVTSIGESAFQGCSGLTSVTIPDSVTSINYATFQGCSGLTSVTIPDSVTSIDYYAFSGCSGLTNIVIPDSVTSFVNAFSGCSGLTNIVIPDSVTSIDYYAFKDCTSLTSVTIGNGVTSIAKYAFNDCSNLATITVKATTPPTLGDDAIPNNYAIHGPIIYVPSGSVTAYKRASGWSNYGGVIDAIQE